MKTEFPTDDTPHGAHSRTGISVRRFVRGCALVSMAISVIEAFALFFHIPSLTQVTADAPAMVLDTALGIMLAACCLLFTQQQRRNVARLTASGLLLLGFLHILVRSPYFSLHSFVFSEFGAYHMARGTAWSFFLLGLGLLVVSYSGGSVRSLRAAAVFGTAVITICFIALFGHATSLREAPWGGAFFYDMSIPAAFSLCALGFALAALFWQAPPETAPRLSLTAAVMATCALLLLIGGVDAAIWRSAESILTTRMAIRATSTEIKTIQGLVSNARNAESGQRGYLLTGETRYLKPFYQGRRTFADRSQSAGSLDTDLVHDLTLKWEELQRTIDLETKGLHREAVQLVRSSETNRLMERIDADAEAIISIKRDKLATELDLNHHSVLLVQKTIVISYALAFLFAVGALFLVTQESRRRSRIESVLRERDSSLAKTNQDLREQTAKAQEASRAKSMFVASMSHEIRTPMNAILGMADILWDSELDAEQRQYVDVFRRAGIVLLDLINSVLDLSKIEGGNLELEHAPFDLEDVVTRSIELLCPRAHAKSIVLLHRIAPELHTKVIGDAGRLQQVLVNLIGNAVKFTALGEVVLRVQGNPVGGCDNLEFTVTDSGIGIEPSQLENVFNDFSQADGSITRQYGGSGLGLGISRRLVEAMGGRLSVTSRVGEGSVFRFTVNIQSDAGTRVSTRDEVEHFHGLRVLVVDDNSTNCLILRETLSSWGIEGIECSTAGEASEELRRSARAGDPYAMVLLDRQMPDMDGFTAIPLLRLSNPGIPIIMLTSDSQPGDAKRRSESGLSGYSVKPVKRADLLGLICKALGTSSVTESASPPLARGAEAILPVDPLRILIAEDSPDNRLLLTAYLRSSPHVLTFVENGEQAAERFANAAFDLVLMDMQMPVMDGLSATRAIRALEHLRESVETPVIALTANALAHDSEASRLAGCNAHLSKPISKRNLLSAIEQFRRAPGQAMPAASIVIEAPDGLEEFAPAYLTSRKNELPVLFQLLHGLDFAAIRRIAHDMKGTGSSFGFPELSRIGEQLQISASDAKEAEVNRQLRQLSDYLGRVRVATTLQK